MYAGIRKEKRRKNRKDPLMCCFIAYSLVHQLPVFLLTFLTTISKGFATSTHLQVPCLSTCVTAVFYLVNQVIERARCTLSTIALEMISSLQVIQSLCFVIIEFIRYGNFFATFDVSDTLQISSTVFSKYCKTAIRFAGMINKTGIEIEIPPLCLL